MRIPQAGTRVRQGRKTKWKKTGAAQNPARQQEKAYGGDVPICMNAKCVMRKKAACFGFEGCPGFKGK
jgi:hypothetical protein